MPTTSQVEKALALIHSSPANAAYFFEKLSSPVWLVPLDERHIFDTPYAAQPKGDLISFPVWAPGEYLARIAGDSGVQQRIVEILLRMEESNNPRVFEAVADAAHAMPAHLAKRLVPLLVRGLGLKYQLLLPDKASTIVVQLAQGGEGAAALPLAEALFVVRPLPREATDGSQHKWRFGTGVVGKVDAWEYEELLERCAAAMASGGGERWLEWLCEQLEIAIRAERSSDDEGEEDYSYVWRPAIAHAVSHRDGIRDGLVSAVRDAAEGLAMERGVAVVLGVLARRAATVFTRIGLWLLSRHPEVGGEVAVPWLQIPDRAGDEALGPEYDAALTAFFPLLPTPVQDRYLAWVAAGPDTSGYVQLRREWEGEEPNEAEVALYVRRWKRDQLTPIQEVLDEPLKAEFKAIVQELGAASPKGVDESGVHSGWVGEFSPLSDEQVRAMSWKDLFDFVKKWVPEAGGIDRPSREGLASVLHGRVALAPEAAVSQLGLAADIPLRYVAAILEGLRAALREKRSFDWEPVLTFGDACVALGAVAPGEEPVAEKRWVREALVSVLEDAFDAGEASIDIALRSRVWSLIGRLAEDPDPAPGSEALKDGSNWDAATLGLNSIRGQALHAAVRYGLWVRRSMGIKDGPDQPKAVLGEMPELREVLDRHLDPAIDDSLGVRAVYGQWFPWLTLLDAKWAAENVRRIFGEPDALRWAAWDTYITYTPPYNDVFPLLRPYYMVAVRRLALKESEEESGRRDPNTKLGEHLMSFYWRGCIESPKDDLIDQFFAFASEKLRGIAVEFGARSLLRSEKPLSPEVAGRLMQFWNWRSEVSTSGEELKWFGGWFGSGKLAGQRATEHLKQLLSKKIRPEPDDEVAEELARMAETDVGRVLPLLEQLVQLSVQDWSIHGWLGEIRTILQKALQSEDETTRATALRLVNLMVQYRFKDFRDLASQRRPSED